MIVLTHDTRRVVSCYKDNKVLAHYHQKPLVNTFFQVAQEFTNHLLIWVHQYYQQALNYKAMGEIFHHQRIMASYSSDHYFSDKIGYVEDSPFIKLSLIKTYPTWQMSAIVGGINTSVLTKAAKHLNFNVEFDYFLTSLAKLIMPQGIFCYSEPNLLLNKNLLEITNKKKATLSQLFRFTAEHYKRRWTILLFFNLLIYEKRLAFLSLLKSFFINRVILPEDIFKNVKIKTSQPFNTCKNVDVIIPTIGRKNYLHDVLKDFAQQTLLPRRVIIIEQHPDPTSKSELDYIYNETWPFEIIHQFIHRTGACHARNLALEQVKSDWVFLADDDNRFNENLIGNIFHQIETYDLDCLTTAYLQQNEKNANPYVSQTSTFGAGNTFVRTNILNSSPKTRFDTSFEFGYGEDVDFGMQLRSKGCDVLITPKPSILHLKASIGGFRTKFKFAWENEPVQPKPSPTVMLYRRKHNTRQQLQSYKLILFIKTFKLKDIFFLPKKVKQFNNRWKASVKWSKTLADAY